MDVKLAPLDAQLLLELSYLSSIYTAILYIWRWGAMVVAQDYNFTWSVGLRPQLLQIIYNPIMTIITLSLWQYNIMKNNNLYTVAIIIIFKHNNYCLAIGSSITGKESCIEETGCIIMVLYKTQFYIDTVIRIVSLRYHDVIYPDTLEGILVALQWSRQRTNVQNFTYNDVIVVVMSMAFFGYSQAQM